jgi:uncharacterized protein YcbK (DUF882 family)
MATEESLDHEELEERIISRRKLLVLTAGVGVAGIVGLTPDDAEAARGRRSLKLVETHTGEKLSVVYRVGNKYSRNGLRKINSIMRDWRNDQSRPIDPQVIDYLYSVRRWLGTNKPIKIVSGYRSPATNAMLARKSGGVARSSYHVKGMAIDIKIDGYSVNSIARAAKAMKLGGVGKYNRSGFVHIDSAEYRTWGR